MTKQEQIEAMAKIIDEMYCVYDTTAGDIAEGLYKAGYGDVSEYKAEIERLRTTLGQCNAELNSALESLKSQCREIGELRAKVKQAKIDVLNEVKKRIYDISPYNPLVLKDDVKRFIDKLIEEIENGTNS